MLILIVEDERNITKTLKMGFEDEGFLVDVAYDGQEGYEKAAVNDYDAIVLDLMLPKMPGLEVCKKLRAEKNYTPIIMLTARDTTEDKITGLDMGADDYLAKPFSFGELLARVNSIIRRSSEKGPVLKVDNIELDPKGRVVTRKGKQIDLTAKEYNLLEYMMNHSNQILTRDQIINHVWDYNYESFNNPVDVYILRLRKKLERKFPQEKKVLHSVRGLGYKLGTKK